MKKVSILGLILLYFGLGSSQAQYTDIFNFNGTNGANPGGSLTLIGNKLFGMTYSGGIHDSGCIFSVDTNGNNYKNLLNFNGTNGAFPVASLTTSLSKKVLYGIAKNGGIYNDGCIFSIDTNGSGYKDLFDFNGINGNEGYGSLTLSGALLFGMTSGGGSHNAGIIFSIDTSGNNFKKLLDFNGANGRTPIGSLTLSGNVLFGMTAYGASGGGNIFHIDTNGNNYQDLFDFSLANGIYPFGSLVFLGSTMYGMTSRGGAHDSGCVFSIDTNGSKYLDCFDFVGSNGANPYGGLTLSTSGKVLYGMTYSGGFYHRGCVFSLDTNRSSFKILLNFNQVNGATPYGYGSLLLSGNMLYGMTSRGGANNEGVVFKIDTEAIAGINELNINNGALSVYPNPSNGLFNLEISHAELVSASQPKVEIYNILGERVYSQSNAQNSTFNINLNNQPNGVYLYRVITESGNLVGEGKLIIQR